MMVSTQGNGSFQVRDGGYAPITDFFNYKAVNAEREDSPAPAIAYGVNWLVLSNSNLGSAPAISAKGDDTIVDINLVPKFGGRVRIAGVPAVTTATSLAYSMTFG
jgi:hypothetical protein